MCGNAVCRNRIRLSAANEVHDFEVVFRLYVRFFPSIARQNLQVAFNRNAISSNSQVSQQRNNIHSSRHRVDFVIHADSNGSCGNILRG